MDKKLFIKLKLIKQELQKEGFIIDGVFGSIARGDDNTTSDIDILYHLENPFFQKYEGFRGFKKLEEIKLFLQNELKKEIDFAPSDNLSETAKKYILKDIVYV
jgi:predicted nucleotidyltransferase